MFYQITFYGIFDTPITKMSKIFEAGYSRVFTKDTDEQFKIEEFETALAKKMVGFIQCYPHLIEKRKIPHIPDSELWVFKFWVEDEKRERMLQEFKMEVKKTGFDPIAYCNKLKQ